MRHFVATLVFSAGARATYLKAQSGEAAMPPSFMQVRAQHVAYLSEQSKAGTIVCAGPTPDYQRGVIILAAESEDAARRLLNADPYMQHGIFEGCELLEFERHQ